MKPTNDYSPETLAVHAGIGDFDGHPVVPPIYQTSTFWFRNSKEVTD